MRCNCTVPLLVRLCGLPDDDRLRQMAEAIVRGVVSRLKMAERTIAAAEGWPAWRKLVAAPRITFSGLALDDALRQRVTSAIEAAFKIAIHDAFSGASSSAFGNSGASSAAPWTPSPSARPSLFLLADYPVTSAGPVLKVGPGGAAAFWQGMRSAIFTRIPNPTPSQSDIEREALRATFEVLLQLIARPEAQALIRDVLDGPAGMRSNLILALEQLKHDQTLVWRLLLYGLERPGDLLGHGPFQHGLDKSPDAIIAFLEATLKNPEEPYRSAAAAVVRRYLEGQFDPANAAHRSTYQRLQVLAARHALYGAGPLGIGAVRERIERNIDILLITLDAVVRPMDIDAPRETSQSTDKFKLDPMPRALAAIRASLASQTPEALIAIDVRITNALEIAFLLPERISTIQQSIRGLGRLLPDDSVPSDEIVVLQALRRRFVLALLAAPAQNSAISDFNAAEAIYSDMRNAVADVKFARLSRLFDEARAAVGNGDGMHQSGGVDDPAFAGMSTLLKGYTRVFVGIFSPHGVGGTTAPVMFMSTPESLESTTQIETDLALYRVLGSMFLLFSVSLRYEHDMEQQEVRNADWRADIARQLRGIRAKIVDFWNREDYQGWVAAIDGVLADLNRLAYAINRGQQTDRDRRTAILLAATLVAGVVGIFVRAALIGVLLEASAGATRLAVAVTLAEATAFTATQIGLEHAVFGKPVTVRGVAERWIGNVAQFAAFGALSRVLGPLGGAGKTWLEFIGRHAAGLTLQIDIAALSLAIQGRGFPDDISHFLIETIGAYAIGASTGYIGGKMQNQAIQLRAREISEQGRDIEQRAVQASNTGRFDEAAFNRLKQDVLAWLYRVETLNQFMRDTGVMKPAEHDAALEVINDMTGRIGAARWKSGATAPYTGQLLLEAGNVPGLVKVGQTGIYRYDPHHPPARLQDLVRSYQRIPSLSTSFQGGTLVVRELGSHRLLLLIGPGPVPAGLLAAPAPGATPPRALSFIESAAGGQLTKAGLASMTNLLNNIYPNLSTLLEAQGDAGMAALSILIAHRTALSRWPVNAIRGLATALELPRAITRSNLERFFARPSAEVAQLFDDFADVADMPGVNLTFRQPATQRTIILIGLYRALRRFKLPDGMDESAHRGMLRMLVDLGRDALLNLIRDMPPERRLAEFHRNDPLATQPPVVPLAQQILDRNAGDLRPGINLGSAAQTPAQVRALIEQFAGNHGATLDAHIPARIEATIATFRLHLRNIAGGIETDGRNVDGVREEFRALMLFLEDGARILSFSRMLGEGAGDAFQAEINVGWHPLRGRITVLHAPTAAQVQIDVLAHKIDYGIVIQEVAFSHLELPRPLSALATSTGAVTIDHGLLGETSSHRKWKQILKYIALQEFGVELARAWGGTPLQVRIIVKYASASPDARAALTNLGVEQQVIAP